MSPHWAAWAWKRGNKVSENLSFLPSQCALSYFCASPRCCNPSPEILGSCEGTVFSCTDSCSNWCFWKWLICKNSCAPIFYVTLQVQFHKNTNITEKVKVPSWPSLLPIPGLSLDIYFNLVGVPPNCLYTFSVCVSIIYIYACVSIYMYIHIYRHTHIKTYIYSYFAICFFYT